MRIEQTLTKERILELYLNEIYLGLQSYGVAAAAQAYFDKSLDKLTIAEAAFLAALPKAPNNYNPFRFPDAARGAARLGARPHGGRPRHHRRAGGRGQGRADRAGRRSAGREPIPGADYFAEEVRRELVDALRRRRDDAGRADGAHHARSGAAGRRRPGAARRADALRPQPRRLARAGGAARRRRRQLRTGWADRAGAACRTRPACCRTGSSAVVLEATDARGEARRGSTAGRRRRADSRACCRCCWPTSPGRGRR